MVGVAGEEVIQVPLCQVILLSRISLLFWLWAFVVGRHDCLTQAEVCVYLYLSYVYFLDPILVLLVQFSDRIPGMVQLFSLLCSHKFSQTGTEPVSASVSLKTVTQCCPSPILGWLSSMFSPCVHNNNSTLAILKENVTPMPSWIYDQKSAVFYNSVGS
jgi:hypothetical protein